MDPASEYSPRRSNRLAGEKSPYLLQHAHNPVDWYPWGPEALDKARREEKPIFLSVGYSTCHWCHVMERESFEDDAVAAFLNGNFVCVKVDREERPDLDKVYMAYVQAVTGSGGWPMSVWLTPDLTPFYGGTYFPPSGKFGRPGFLDLLRGISEAWAHRRADLVASGASAIDRMREQVKSEPPTGEPLTEATLGRAAEWFERSFDGRLGGFGSAPKFPRPSALLYLLRRHHVTGDNATGDVKFLDMTVKTLDAMARGGMYDQLGGGFHRYSVDARWHVPHFEKMLYDQGQLAVAYAEGFQATRSPLHEAALRGICDYVLRDLTAPGGAFYSAEDADSLDAPVKPGEAAEKREGAFYAFTADEIRRAAGADAPLVSLYYGVEEGGNAEDPHGELTGKNVLYVAMDLDEAARRAGVPAPEAPERLARAKAALLDFRNRRPRPHLDDKILTSWNGLMIAGLARAAFVLDEPRYAAAAVKAAEFVLGELAGGGTGRLHRRHRQGESAIPGQCDDYAYLVWGLLELHAATQDPAYLTRAAELARAQDALFRDPVGGAWFSAPEGDPTLLLRFVEDYDGAEPAPSSVAVWNAVRLAELTGDAAFRVRADEALRGFASRLNAVGAAVPQMLVALDAWLSPPEHVVVVDGAGAADLRRAAARPYLPNACQVFLDGRSRAYFAERLPWTAGMKPVGGRAAAYVCVDHACQLPVSGPAELDALLVKRPARKP